MSVIPDSRIKITPSAQAICWSVALVASALPDILWQEIAGTPPLWLYWIKAGMLASLILITWLAADWRPLRLYFVLLFVVVIGWGFQTWFMSTPGWEGWEEKIPWLPGMLVIQLFEFVMAGLVVVTLLLFKRRLRDAYLTKGDLRAVASPVRWLGQRTPSTWPEFGTILAAALFFGGILFLWLMNPPSGVVVKMVLPLLPGVVLIAAINSIDEEVIYRCGMMHSLEAPVGMRTALWSSAVFFGLAHFSGGFPGGLPWFLLTGFIGTMLGKSMQETRGFLWAFLIHLIADVPVLAFSAMATLASRGF